MSIKEIAGTGGDRSLHAGHVSATWVLVEHLDRVGADGKKRKKKDDLWRKGWLRKGTYGVERKKLRTSLKGKQIGTNKWWE
jgi:hypothetical protein